ncbi:hypothetical protein KKF82_08680 [Patescibacteria group bacterium]|nr:hypothetical protein [Patescibacteria group bacterium]
MRLELRFRNGETLKWIPARVKTILQLRALYRNWLNCQGLDPEYTHFGQGANGCTLALFEEEPITFLKKREDGTWSITDDRFEDRSIIDQVLPWYEARDEWIEISMEFVREVK